MSTISTMTEGLLIDGARGDASDGGTFDVVDPSTGERLATVAKATRADVNRAVESAHAALDSKAWGGMPPAERGRIMWRIAAAIRERFSGATGEQNVAAAEEAYGSIVRAALEVPSA